MPGLYRDPAQPWVADFRAESGVYQPHAVTAGGLWDAGICSVGTSPSCVRPNRTCVEILQRLQEGALNLVVLSVHCLAFIYGEVGISWSVYWWRRETKRSHGHSQEVEAGSLVDCGFQAFSVFRPLP